MDDQTLSSLITLAALIIFAISGWAAMWLFRAQRSGWMKLASIYGTSRKYESPVHRWNSIRFMPAKLRYRKVVNFQLTVDGLYLTLIAPFKLGHDALLIPWNDIEIFAVDTYPADRLYDLKFALEPDVKMRVGVAVAQGIRRAADNVHYFATEANAAPSPRQTAVV